MAFSIFQEKIIIILGRSGRPRPINEIREETGISWVTLKKHLLALERRNVVIRERQKKRFAWRLNIHA